MGRFQRIRKLFRDNFFSGLLVVVPVVVTIYVLAKLLHWLYRKLVFLPLDNERIAAWLSTFIPDWGIMSATRLVHVIEFIAVLIIIAFATALVGLFTKIRFTRWILAVGERVLARIPLVGVIYSGLKQFLEAIFSGKGNFSKVVMVQFPMEGIWSVGFITREADPSIAKLTGAEKLYNIFVPTTPNVTTGFLVMARPDQFIELDISVDQAFKFIISGGMVLPDEDDVTEPGRASIIDRIKGAAAN
ncbi:MAG TPA: DUF502 domain-containing protein [bacterium]|nr:DUF502 domain-containing protein [bacterium]